MFLFRINDEYNDLRLFLFYFASTLAHLYFGHGLGCSLCPTRGKKRERTERKKKREEEEEKEEGLVSSLRTTTKIELS